jgi:predicted small secreted protein
MMNRIQRWLLLGLLALVVAACTPPNTADAAGQAVKDYLQAKISADQPKLTALLCKEREADAEREAMSFVGIKAEFKDVVCKKNDNAETVTCTGAIIAEYNNEPTPILLSTYRVVQENGAWKWCGEAAP